MSDIPIITAMEKVVLDLTRSGKSAKEAAFELGISVKTVQAHKFNLYKKLGAHSVADLCNLTNNGDYRLIVGDSQSYLLTRIDKKLDRLLAAVSADSKRIDWIENFVQTGVLESAFEIDGGIHVTLSTVGDTTEKAYREKNSFRDAIDEAMKG